MTESEEKEESINSLCKKYFTPELCEEPVTESKNALKGKILKCLIKYGDMLVLKLFPECKMDFSMVVLDTIENSWKNWPLENPSGYSSYFYKAIKQNCISEFKKKDNNNKSADETVYYNSEDDSNKSIYDIKKDEKNPCPDESLESKDCAFQIIKIVDRVFRLRKRSEWLKAAVTCKLYDGLHACFDSYPNPVNKVEKLSFINLDVYNWKEKPSQQDIAEFVNVDTGQFSRDLKSFFAPIKESINKNLEYYI